MCNQKGSTHSGFYGNNSDEIGNPKKTKKDHHTYDERAALSSLAMLEDTWPAQEKRRKK